MKKIYLTLGLSALLLSATAQQAARKQSVKGTSIAASIGKSGHNATSAIVCDTLQTFAKTDSITLYTVSSANGGGYVTGNNGYGDIEKANFFPASMIPSGGQVTAVIAFFYKNGTLGTKGTGTVSMNILNGDTLTGPTGAAVGTVTASLTAITAGTASGALLPYIFTYTAPVTAPAAGFFCSLVLPTTTGDTAALWVNKNHLEHNNYAWDNGSAGWLAFSNTNDWTLQKSLTLLPIVCFTSSGIHNNILEASTALYPNPSNGQFNFATVLPNSTNLTVNVISALGQVVFTHTENNITSGSFSYDLTSLPKGIYSVQITDSQNNKMVRKVVIQ